MSIMFVFSVAQYLLIRKASLNGMPVPVQNFANFIIPLFVYLPFAIISHTSFFLTPYQLFILIASAILFSYLGSMMSFLSLSCAPNPGYSLIISKSYVVFTTLASVVLFHQTLTFRALLAIAMIIGCSALIVIDPKKTHKSHVKAIWLPLSIGAFFAWGLLALSSRYQLELGVPIYIRLMYSMAIVSALIFGEMRKAKVSVLALSRANKWLFVGIGVTCAGFNYLMQVGYAIAPNVGYVNAVNAASIAFVSIGASLLFHDEWNIRKFIGVIGVIIGLIVLVL